MNIGPGAVILGGGYGSFRKDGKQPFPKVLEDVCGLPMIVRVLHIVAQAKLYPVSVVVNSLFAERISRVVREAGFNDVLFHIHNKRCGSAGAAMLAMPALRKAGVAAFLAVYADNPLWRPETIEKLVINYSLEETVASMVSISLAGAPSELYRYGRIIRNQGARGAITKIVEPADATAEELAADAVNPSLWIWHRQWFEKHAPLVPPTPKQDGFPPERYMPPLVKMAALQGRKIVEVPIDDHYQALGVNTPAELEIVRQIANSRLTPPA